MDTIHWNECGQKSRCDRDFPHGHQNRHWQLLNARWWLLSHLNKYYWRITAVVHRTLVYVLYWNIDNTFVCRVTHLWVLKWTLERCLIHSLRSGYAHLVISCSSRVHFPWRYKLLSLIVCEYGTIILVARQNIPFHIISVGIQGQIQSIVLDSTVGAHQMHAIKCMQI